MKINIQHVKENIGAEQDFHFSFSPSKLFEQSEHVWVQDPVEVSGRVVNDGLLLKVSGIIKFTAKFECDRCLEKYTTDYEISFGEKFHEAAIDGRVDDMSVYQGDYIDITELLIESIVLAKPLKTVCCEECQGLCPKCGINLNLSTCACERRVVDPRLAALQQLLDKE